ncbi:sugar ABC transporter permease [Clostridia bacterium]|nr:sugar ABC transporter permease [Clostridia bacterium]
MLFSGKAVNLSNLSAKTRLVKTGGRIVKQWQLYLLLLVPVMYLAIFRYYPMYGIQIALKDYNPALGVVRSPWSNPVWRYFRLFLQSPFLGRLLKNTITISSLSIICSFPIPIILALSLNECGRGGIKKTVQTVTYIPYFISTVVLISMVIQIFSPYGLVNNVLKYMGMPKINIMARSSSVLPVYILSGIWQGTGYSAVVYIASLSAINSELYEAAVIDGANILQKIRHIDIPSILPTAVILLILSSGSILNVGFEKIFLLQNPLNMNVSDVIATYVYRIGLESAQYSYSAAIGLFNSIISTIILVCVNAVAKRLSSTSLW